MPESQRVSIVTLGCARNEVDSEELAARLAADGWELIADPGESDAVIVNTCGFVDIAKKDSIDAVIAAADLKDAADGPRKVVAVGCLSERYGRDLADELREADAVLGFDDYPHIADRLRQVMAGEVIPAHEPADRRTLLPIAPVDRHAGTAVIPGHGEPVPGWAPPVLRRRLDDSPVAPVKLASGCDRRCAFCAIPSFRGSFVSRDPAEVIAEIAWLAEHGVREAVLVSENSTSYGKDLSDLRLLEALLPAIGRGTDIARVRVAYLQPAEVRPGLLQVIAQDPVVASYFDLSFQHASPGVLRRMRRFGGRLDFLALLEQIRALDPAAGVRSNVIVGFPGETRADVEELIAFLVDARLDAIGVFGYSDEDGTEAVGYDGKLDAAEIAARVAEISALADELMAQRAEERIGSRIEVLVESIEDDDGARVAVGRAAHQGPDDAVTTVRLKADGPSVVVGDIVAAVVVQTEGVDLIAERG
jgi:ribosomal protein S12 methylthiotransferase